MPLECRPAMTLEKNTNPAMEHLPRVLFLPQLLQRDSADNTNDRNPVSDGILQHQLCCARTGFQWEADTERMSRLGWSGMLNHDARNLVYESEPNCSRIICHLDPSWSSADHGRN
ncbi:hypothetical protein OPV22_011018 [Ensete ventricosum]|uniref:Uncharacterized protein n=1 Tax=Ensete ventricosum TaxID=4639 RepID=A0AAV8RIN0_ENSVE|nr:hypothetical protein OPV22_011018 [Ensete ventricosum]